MSTLIADFNESGKTELVIDGCQTEEKAAPGPPIIDIDDSIKDALGMVLGRYIVTAIFGMYGRR